MTRHAEGDGSGADAVVVFDSWASPLGLADLGPDAIAIDHRTSLTRPSSASARASRYKATSTPPLTTSLVAVTGKYAPFASWRFGCGIELGPML